MLNRTFNSRHSKILIFTALLLCIAIIYGSVYFFFFRKTPLGSLYTLSDELSLSQAANKTSAAMKKNEALKNLQYAYAFFVEYENKDSLYRFGTENIIAVTGNGTESAKAHRINTATKVKNGTQQNTESESFYFSDGKIYTKRFNTNYWSEMDSSDFIPYTEYSDMSVDKNFLSEIFFKKAKLYSCLNGTTEIAYTGANDSIKEGIISFIGLNQTNFEYTISDVVLTAVIAENGMLAEKHLNFTVEFYQKDDKDNVVTYNGDFSYTLDKTSNISVKERNKADGYQQISNIQLLSSITETGYTLLLSKPGLDVSYEKDITVSDSEGNSYFYKGQAQITAAMVGDTLYYSSIDTEKYKKDSLTYNTAGIFINENGYTEKIYDYQKNETTSSRENEAHDYTNKELTNIIMGAIAGERLYEGEIRSVDDTPIEDADTVTYLVDLTPSAKKYFCSYLLDTFSENGDSSTDISSLIFGLDKCNVTITVRKSDGCIIYQLIDYKATISGSVGMSGEITVTGRCEMKVNSTDGNLTLLTPDNYNAIVESNKNA